MDYQIKIKTKPNSDGLIKCLPQPGQLLSQPLKSMLENSYRLSTSLRHDNFVSWDKVYVGLRADALAPCFLLCHLDNFIVTRNFTAIYRDCCRLDNFIMTQNSQLSTGTGKKHVTATQTAPNQTAGPLAISIVPDR